MTTEDDASPDGRQWTALDYAKFNGRRSTADLLEDLGAQCKVQHPKPAAGFRAVLDKFLRRFSRSQDVTVSPRINVMSGEIDARRASAASSVLTVPPPSLVFTQSDVSSLASSVVSLAVARVDTVEDALSSLSLEMYKDAFLQQEIDMDAFVELDEACFF